MTARLVSAVFAAALAATATAQVQIWDNGPFETGLSPAGARISEVPLPAYDTFGIVSAGYLATPQRAADNFTLANPAGTQLAYAVWYAYQTGSPPANPFTKAYVGIYNVDPTGTQDLAPAFGSVDPNSPNRLLGQTFTGVYRVRSDSPNTTSRPIYGVQIDLSWCPPLPPGQYWIAVGLAGTSDAATVASISTLPVPPTANAICMGRNRGTGCAAPNPELTTWTCADGEIADGCFDCDPYDFAFEVWAIDAPVSGACCIVTGACEVLTAAECDALSGAYQGNFSPCDPNPCPQPTGACCLPNRTCLSARTQAECEAVSGVFGGGASECETATEGTIFQRSESPAAAIPDASIVGLTRTLSVSEHVAMYNVDVALDISNHARISDLQVTLTHAPSGVSAIVWNQRCFEGGPYAGLNAVFGDGGAPPVCASPTTGFILAPDMAAFEGLDAFGDWTLNVRDLVGTQTGALSSWTLQFTRAAPNSVCAPSACAGDMNCDGVVNFGDIDPFVLALQGQSAYQAQFPNCQWLNGDVNGDSAVNFSDIDPFVARIGQPCP